MKMRVLVGFIASAAFTWSASVQAATLTSADFSLAYGSDVDNTNPVTVWRTNETAGTNTATTIGDFTFAPAPVGASWDVPGPTFVNRTLATGAGNNVAWFGNPAARPFAVPVTASYNGAAPGDVSGTPDYKLQIEITKISVYGARYDANQLATMAWDETTSGHTQTSPSVNLQIVFSAADTNNASKYTLLDWNPDDYDVSIASLNDTFTRTFDILPGDSLDYRFGDGLIIEGRVHLTYNAVPEPMSFILFGIGLLGMVGYGKYRRMS